MFFCEEESPPAAGMLSSFTACRISSSISVVICTSATLFPLAIDFSILVTYDREQESALRRPLTSSSSSDKQQYNTIQYNTVMMDGNGSILLCRSTSLSGIHSFELTVSLLEWEWLWLF